MKLTTESSNNKDNDDDRSFSLSHAQILAALGFLGFLNSPAYDI